MLNLFPKNGECRFYRRSMGFNLWGCRGAFDNITATFWEVVVTFSG